MQTKGLIREILSGILIFSMLFTWMYIILAVDEDAWISILNKWF